MNPTMRDLSSTQRDAVMRMSTKADPQSHICKDSVSKDACGRRSADTYAGDDVERERASAVPFLAKLKTQDEVKNGTDETESSSHADEAKVDGLEDSVGEELRKSEVSQDHFSR